MDAGADLFLGASCPGCQRPGYRVCRDCLARLRAGPVIRQAVRLPLPADLGARGVLVDGSGLAGQRTQIEYARYLFVHSATSYGSPVDHLLLAHKDRGAWRLARPLGDALAAVVRAQLAGQQNTSTPGTSMLTASTTLTPGATALKMPRPRTSNLLTTTPGIAAPGILVPGILAQGITVQRAHTWVGSMPAVTLCPVPSDPAAVRERGYDHCAALARYVGRCLKVPVRALLRRARAAGDQVGRSAAARRDAQRDTMCCRRSGGGVVVIIDDIVTTGATLVEAARALQSGGYQVLFAATVAATPRPSQRSGGP